MAMIETTDCIFKEVNDKMNERNHIIINNLLPMISDEYEKIIAPEVHQSLSDSILDAYYDKINNINKEEF